MAENRTPRDTQSRAASARPQVWAPPDLLPEIDRQAGFTYRWVRTSMMDKTDPGNISSRLREGWEPVKLQEQPQMKFFLDPDSRFKDNIEIGGLLLCKAPEELMEQRKAYYANQSARQMEAVDNNLMRQNDPRMPLFKQRESKTTFGSGS